ncbi:ABC transporter permease [Patulibacter medicamentivorans]|uniref:ABC transporter permease n=1 Tax=Patulibacter medicamentivorans TaxID=1097667 RepID=UPI00031D0953|nr:ABC transporter permease [Patulibacter medicamentivorans]
MSTPLAILGIFGDAIDFIFNAREARTGGAEVGGLGEFASLTGKHLLVTVAAVGLASLVALPLGLYLGHKRRGGFLAVSVSNVGRAVPSLVLIALFIAFLGVGFANVALALALLAIPPILTNAYVGVTQVDRDVIDAAVGQGLTDGQVMRQIELPLALPLIFGGLRTSVVNVIATATIAPIAGVVTLGDPIISQSVYGDAGKLAAAIVVALLAVVAEVGLGAAQRAVTPAPLRGTPGATRRGRFFVKTAGKGLSTS